MQDARRVDSTELMQFFDRGGTRVDLGYREQVINHALFELRSAGSVNGKTATQLGGHAGETKTALRNETDLVQKLFAFGFAFGNVALLGCTFPELIELLLD